MHTCARSKKSAYRHARAGNRSLHGAPPSLPSKQPSLVVARGPHGGALAARLSALAPHEALVALAPPFKIVARVRIVVKELVRALPTALIIAAAATATTAGAAVVPVAVAAAAALAARLSAKALHEIVIALAPLFVVLARVRRVVPERILADPRILGLLSLCAGRLRTFVASPKAPPLHEVFIALAPSRMILARVLRVLPDLIAAELVIRIIVYRLAIPIRAERARPQGVALSGLNLRRVRVGGVGTPHVWVHGDALFNRAARIRFPRLHVPPPVAILLLPIPIAAPGRIPRVSGGDLLEERKLEEGAPLQVVGTWDVKPVGWAVILVPRLAPHPAAVLGLALVAVGTLGRALGADGRQVEEARLTDGSLGVVSGI